MRIAPDTLTKLQLTPEAIRNICILAHVDHGKTSLSDSLLASNGIISQKLAGKVRFLDSRPDEQLRGITMESSAISLYFRVLKKQEGSDTPSVSEHLINLIDSPGHIDFSSEVSAASRLCDGAVVLVDVVEGVCSQTVTVLRQSWLDDLKPVLVLNKIDRLVTELKLTPLEAYQHLSKVIEQVNSIIGSFFAGERMQDDMLWREYLEKNAGADKKFVEKDDEDIYFNPENKNVIFASAIDGWGFNIGQFAKLYAEKLGIKRENLQKVLWGDYYLEPKTKKILTAKSLRNKPTANMKPLFVSLILENIWAVYENTMIDRNPEKLEKIIKALNLRILPRELRSKDEKGLLTAIMGQWLPVSTAVLLTVVERLPSPSQSQKERIPKILASVPGATDDGTINKDIERDMLKCDYKGLSCAYVSKMLSIPESELPRNNLRVNLTDDEFIERGRIARLAAQKAADAARALEESTTEAKGDSKTANDEFVITSALDSTTLDDPFGWEEEEEEEEEDPFGGAIEVEKEELIGFARVYSGTLTVGQEITVVGPRYDPSRSAKYNQKYITTTIITELYLIMGRELVSINEVPAGSIAGIGGLGGKILKNGTLVDTRATQGLVNLAAVSLLTMVPPILRVAVEPVNPTHMDRLERGLQLLNQADACVSVFVQSNGEHILAVAGELHLERCLKDLKERFAGCEIQTSEPVIPYRETTLSLAKLEMNAPKNPEMGPRGTVVVEIGNHKITYAVRPLPETVIQFLSDNSSSIQSLVDSKHNVEEEEEEEEEEDGDALLTGNNKKRMSAEAFRDELASAFDSLSEKEREAWGTGEQIAASVVAFGPKRVGPNLLLDNSNMLRRIFETTGEKTFLYQDSILNGFHLGTYEGPLAAEPVQGIAVLIQSIEEVDSVTANVSGRFITATRDAIHQGFLDWSPRIMLAMYLCDIQATAEVLGKVYAVIQRRRGQILLEEMKEGTPFFTITAKIPVVEAFGFSEDIRKKSSGAASPQLVFSGFEAVDEDPFWVPTTEEELEELGDLADKENVARKYVTAIRTSKGLFVEKKVVENAEKQRTLKKD
ncbi:hypothetical protein BABINDRAFT_159307 [Babjeviella inositovora NRRL Y-12698]|uniref:Ribosome assembly protein 1 n=1 Tax=Babjeviella inositovora NRRL Y-12698 TaxID=984486 RepID=A0A1E3QYW3_9ASCO|nr:uncharacterized protein BABINDRAFT_159307 [Babjeviella inositovora NRRL Y-12698]ODQ82805.1 hypothetical protein BABINDRAFT_159307 [Babjeviella inositovora NRRL Y-12698]